MTPDQDPQLTVIACGPGRCEHVFDGPEVPVSDDPAHPGGLTTTCSKCGARAIDVCYWI